MHPSARSGGDRYLGVYRMLWPWSSAVSAVTAVSAVSLATGAVVVSLVVTTPPSSHPGSSAAADQPRSPATAHALTVTPARPIAGEQTTFSGRISAGAPRPVRLQSHATGAWRTIATGRTSATGRFGLSTRAPQASQPSLFRVVAPARFFHHHRIPVVRSASATVSPSAQTANLTGPATASAGADLVLAAHFGPARAGRPVDIQRQTTTGWETVGSTQEDPTGLATWHGSAPTTAGSVTYRATAAAWHGAAASTATRDVALVAAPSKVALLSKSTGNLTHVSCATDAFCVAIDDNGNATTYDGTSWTPPTPVDTRIRLSDVSCPTAAFCMAVDDSGYAVTFDGSGWSAPILVDPVGRPSAVSCADASFCASVGFGGTATTYDGTTWSKPVTIAEENFADVSCPSTGHCVALGFDGRSFRYDGTTWSGLDSLAAGRQTTALSCADPTFCVAVDSAGHGYTYNGASWSGATDAPGHLYSVWCPTRTYCAAGTATGTVTTFDGTAWSALTSSGLAQSSDLACPSSTTCVLVGDSGAAVRTGATWTATQPDPRSGGMVSVSCVDATWCLAAAADGRVFGWDGSAWGNPVTVDPNGRPTSLSCASRGLCALVDDQGLASTFDGSRWSTPESAAGSALRHVSCAPTSDPVSDMTCVAVGDDGSVHSLGADGWAAEPVVDDAGFRDVSCATRAWCVAVDVQGRSVGYAEGSWGTPVPITGVPTVPGPAVSCPVAGFCVATLQWGGARTYDGTAWSDAGFLHGQAPAASAQAVSCGSETSCTAALNDGTAQYDGSGWSDPDLGLVTGLTDISCPTSGFCAAVDQYGYARVLD